ncbi:MAG: thrombospondin type 3 repeat-containing protein [Acidobacteriota bacterium]|nr:thrombospondin type 3 repeat-containing protein [Acidobacteriota bacterium]
MSMRWMTVWILVTLGGFWALPAAAATFTVDFTDDIQDAHPGDGSCATSGGLCTLRAAIEETNALAGAPHTIELPALAAGMSYQVLDTGTLELQQDVTIRGLGSDPVPVTGDIFLTQAIFTTWSPNIEVVIENLELRPRATAAIAGFFAQQVDVDVTFRDTVFISGDDQGDVGLVVQDGTVLCERCEFRDGDTVAINVTGGELRLVDSEVRNNRSPYFAGAGLLVEGGTTYLHRSLVEGNIVGFGAANTGDGGGLHAIGGQVTLVNSTISGNSASRHGGGIYVKNAWVVAQSSTIAFNRADWNESGQGNGGGIYTDSLGFVQLEGTILSDNEDYCNAPFCLPDGWDCDGLGLESLGYNVIHYTLGCTITETRPGTDHYGQSAQLAILGAWGGETPTHPIFSTGPAADGGDPAGCFADGDLDPMTADQALTEDQRGSLRPEDGNRDSVAVCDVGAFELNCAEGFDFDTDGIGVFCDNCPSDSNPGQEDGDADDVGDVCDNCPQDPNTTQQDTDSDGLGNACDNCEFFSNPDQANGDGDSLGDACDNCPLDTNQDQADGDGDGVGTVCDNCPGDANAGQEDPDGDGLGSACDICPDDADPGQEDTDSDGFGDACDNCPDASNSDQTDTDGDDVGNFCDNCDDTPNPDQANADGDGFGDACDCLPDHSGVRTGCLSCGGFDLYRQPFQTPDLPSLYVSSATQTVAESPVDASHHQIAINEAIGGIRIWGHRVDPLDEPCRADGDLLVVRFYSDDAGSPGILLAERSGVPTVTDTGLELDYGPDGQLPLLQHDLTFDTGVAPPGKVWVAFYIDAGGSCAFRATTDTVTTTWDNEFYWVGPSTRVLEDLPFCLGRGGDPTIFTDGFESGTLGAWSRVVSD